MADWEQAQEKAFLGWVNNHLKDGGYPEVENLEDGFRGLFWFRVIGVPRGGFISVEELSLFDFFH